MWRALVLALGAGSSGLKVTIEPIAVEAPFLLLMPNVGLTPGAELSLNLTSSGPGAVFLLLSSEQFIDWIRAPPRLASGNLTWYIASQWRQPLSHHLDIRTRLSLPKVEFFYAGIFDPNMRMNVIQGELDFVNANQMHLPYQWAHLPLLWGVASITFSLFVQFAVVLTSTVWYRASTPLHGLLMLCAALKAMELAVRADLFRGLADNGDAPPWKFQAFRLLHNLASTFELLLMVLIALGWKVLRSRLSEIEMRCIRLGFTTGVVLSFLQAEVSSEPLRLLSAGLTNIFQVIQMIVNLAVILTVNQNLQIIDIGLSDTQFSPTAILMYRKQQAYFRFRAAFYLMFLRPTIVAWLHLTVLRGNTEWLVFGLSQVLALVVYLLLLDGLRPTTDKRGLMKLWRSEVRSRSRSPRPAGLEAPAAAGTNLGAQTEPTEEAAIPELATPYVEF